MSTVVLQSPDELRYLAPEIQLLYKSKAPRERDEADFAQICPLLAADARRWLPDTLELTTPHHKWIPVLRDSEVGFQ